MGKRKYDPAIDNYYYNPSPGTVVIGRNLIMRVVISNNSGRIEYRSNSNQGMASWHTSCDISTWKNWIGKFQAISIEDFLEKHKSMEYNLLILQRKLVAKKNQD